jgi:cell wall-associated NlpC family hydrolase
MSELTPDDVRRWDAGAVLKVFQVANARAATLQNFGADLGQVGQQLAGWDGETGTAFHASLGRTRTDIESDGHESARVASAVCNAWEDVQITKGMMSEVDQTAQGLGFTITEDWKVGMGNAGLLMGSTEARLEQQILQGQLDTVKVKAHATDHELATAIRAAVGDAQLDQNGREIPQAPPPASQNSVPGPHPGDPPYATGQKPTLAGDPADHPPMKIDPGSSDSVVLQDNPPGYDGPAGPARDAAWRAYLTQQSGTTTGAVNPRVVMPNPDAVSDPGLKTVGAAAKQQGVSYAWGGGHASQPGVSRGTLNSEKDESWTFHDNQRTGFDCAGLARFATAEGRGFDINSGDIGNTVGQYGALTAPGGHGQKIPDAALQPGDLIYYGAEGNSHHVVVYAGNGMVIQAHGSGIPVEVSPMDHSEQHFDVHVHN